MSEIFYPVVMILLSVISAILIYALAKLKQKYCVHEWIRSRIDHKFHCTKCTKTVDKIGD